MIDKVKKLLEKEHVCFICKKKANCIDLNFNKWICNGVKCNEKAIKKMESKKK